MEETLIKDFSYSILSDAESLILNYSKEVGARERTITENLYFTLDVSQFTGNLRLRRIDLKLKKITGGSYSLRIADEGDNELAVTRHIDLTQSGWKEFTLVGSLDLEPYPQLIVSFNPLSGSDRVIVDDSAYCDQEVIDPLIRVWSLGTGDERRRLQLNQYTGQIEFIEDPVIPTRQLQPPLTATSDIQNALDSIPCETGGKVILSAGVYPIDQTIEIPCNNITLEGSEGGSIISGSQCIDLLHAFEKSNIRIEKITFASTSCDCAGDGIVFSGTSNSKILDCRFFNLGKSGIKLIGCRDNTLERNFAIGNHHFGLIAKACQYVRSINNITDQNWGSGIVIQDSSRVSILDSSSRGNNDDGILIWNSSIIHARNNYLNDNSCGAGISLHNGDQVFITENEISTNYYGVFADDDSASVILTNNLIFGCVQDIEMEDGGVTNYIKFESIPTQSIPAQGSKWLEIDTDTFGAEITSITLNSLIGQDWRVEVFIPVQDGISEPRVEDKRTELIYSSTDSSGGHLIDLGAIRFNAFLRFVNLSSTDQVIGPGTIAYNSLGSLNLVWGE